MVPYGQRLWRTLLLAAGLTGLLSGCFGVSQNPSYFPHLLSTGDIIRTHAKPPCWGYFSDFDPHACRLEVRPLTATNPVQTQVVLIATVYDADGKPRRDRRVEWMLEGSGNIVEVDESGFFPGRGYKVDNKYAVSYTAYREHTITRGNNNASDDFVIRPGQTWCVISSAVEGDSYVTAYAPEIYNWDAHKVFVTNHWVDAEWVLPVPAVNRAGTQHVFNTQIFRHTDRQPLANYKVHYRIVDGPPAVFLPSQTQELFAVSDLNGNAQVTLAQVAPVAGVNRVAVEIIRPPDPLRPSGAGIVIGRGETTKEWQAAALALTKTGPPTAGVGEEIPYTITITNTGRVESQPMTVRDVIPDAVQFVRAQPQAVIEGNQLAWSLGGLPPGQAHAVQVVFRSTRVGPVVNVANVTTVDGIRAENSTTTQVAAPALNVTMAGPLTGVVGSPISYQVTVTNAGSAPATNLVLKDDFDPGLEHETGTRALSQLIGTLAPGESQNRPVTLTPRRVGRLVNRVTATADGGLLARAEHAVNVEMARLSLKVNGPTVRYVDRNATWDLRVDNTGDVPLGSVIVRDVLPPELSFVSATEGGQAAEGQVTWNLGTLPAHEQKFVQVTTRCLRATARALSVASAVADPGLQVREEAPLEIRGVPAFRLEAIDVQDPVEVGGRTGYRIDVTNQGSLPGAQVEITATVPPQMRVLNAEGPVKPLIQGQQVIFPPVNALQPKQVLHYSVDVEAIQAGDARFRVELRAATLTQPVIEEESTTIKAPITGAAPAAAPPPAVAPTPPAPSPAGTPAPAPARPPGI